MANQNNKNGGQQEQLLQIRRDKLETLRQEGLDPFVITKFDVTHHTNDIRVNFEELEFEPPVDEEGKAVVVDLKDIPEGKVVTLAGRMMFKRVMAACSFIRAERLRR